MPKQGTRAEVNTFVKGLITEASPLNFPANASFDEENFQLNRDGTRQRRLGLAFEDFYQLVPATTMVGPEYLTKETNTFVWSGVNGNSEKDVLIVQTGNHLRIHDLSAPVLSTSTLFDIATVFDPRVKLSFTAVNGKLIVAGGLHSIMLISFDGTTFYSEYRQIRVRDEWGMQDDDALEIDNSNRPTTLSEVHRYNLYNQSWGIPRRDGSGATTNPVTTFFTELAAYPSNNEVVWTGLAYQPVTEDGTSTSGTSTTTVVDPDTGETSTVTTSTGSTNGYNDPYERMFTNLYQERLGADVKAAKGYFIINLLNRGLSRTEELQRNKDKYPLMTFTTPFKADTTTGGASCVAEFAGRVFYAGFNGEVLDGDKRSPVLNNYVAFSQLVRNDTDVIKCYQEGDPSSRNNSDIVDTDGGFFRVSGAKKIIGMRQLNGKLIILADNGVWVLSGGSDFGFSATNYKVEKKSSYGCLTENSIVVNGSSLMYWGSDSIYNVAQNQYGEVQVTDMTSTTIQTFYNSLMEYEKKTVTGIYDLFEKKVKWTYRTGGALNLGSRSNELIFDTVLGAFYKYKIFNHPSNSYDVFNVFFNQSLIDPVYFVMHRDGDVLTYTFAKYKNTQFKDWGTTDASAFLITGALTSGDSAIAKQAPYLVVHMARTETGKDEVQNLSSCKMRSQWNWSSSSKSNKFGALVEVYKYRKPILTTSDYDTGEDVVTSRNKLRGRGKSVAFYFETTPERDCQLLGWSLTINGNGVT